MSFYLPVIATFAAASPPLAELIWLPGSGAGACNQGRLEDAVATRLGYRPFVRGSELRIVVELSGKTKLQARLRTFQPGKESNESSFSGPADCDALTEALALALAVTIDPLSPLGQELMEEERRHPTGLEPSDEAMERILLRRAELAGVLGER